MFIEIHAIQNFAPSNLNRDDTNNPKDCVFGGVRRARISSQCLKRAIRLHPRFAEVSGVPVSQRTRLITAKIKETLEKAGVQADAAQSKAEAFAGHYSSKKAQMDAKDKTRTGVLLFMSENEIDDIATRLSGIKEDDEIKKFAEAFAKGNGNRPGAPDIAMFGRMLADRPETNIDAACQVAHAISTHSVAMDLDFFTAVDDLQKEGETGAGMMGVIGFNSACFYRYACIDVEQLTRNLNGDRALACKTVEAFLHASTFAIPSGKQNSFAAHNPPTLLLAVVRRSGPCWSLANAFEKPVSQGVNQSLLQASIKALDGYWDRLNTFFGGQPAVFTALLDDNGGLDSLKDSRLPSFSAWVEAVTGELAKE